MTIQVKIAEFETRRQDIEKMRVELTQAEQALQTKVDAFIEENKGQVNELGQKYEKALQEFRADLKATFGITEGEKITVLETVAAIKKIAELQ